MTPPEFATTNLSKIKTSFRTKGNITGNFGVPKSKSGSSLQTLGETKGSVGNLPTQQEYLNRMIEAYNKTTDIKLKKFIFEEIRKIKIQNGTWSND